jgi:phosphatidylserine/phosphatidylglycerophosphate/cardiolipin synthase-like enzyme
VARATVPFETTSAHSWLLDTVQHQEFCKTDWPQLSCPHPVTSFEPLETPESGFLAKVEMLLGQKPPADFIKNGDPYAPLDFSKAPKLKAIYLSSLVFRADFYGTVMAKLLKFHADRRALVNVVTTDYMMLQKDRSLLEPLAAQNPNFKLDKFRYNNPGGLVSKATNLVTDKYRDMHIKLFITLSDEKESDNAIIFGGRNIHDGFLYKELPDHSRFPELVQYGKDDDFVHWNDFEAKVTSKELATSTAAHLQRFLSRNKSTQAMVPFSKNTSGPSGPSGNAFRHFISVPYADNHALEKQYVKMIDSAENSIKISSPYLRPTPEITAALKRAAKKGVDIQIQTRVELTGDTQAWLYEEVNKESINALSKQAKIYKWKENSILHSKFLLVDSNKAMIGSVNMSRRSFVQDVENGFLIENASVTKSMEKIFESYVSKSEQVTKPLPRKVVPTLIIKTLENQF